MSKKYVVTLTHTEIIEVDAENETDAAHKAYRMADAQCVWDEVDIEETDENDDE